MTNRLRRSFLYTPADDLEMLEKAATLDEADAVIFDLEDAVPDEVLPSARQNIESVLRRTDFNETEICVRINGLQTSYWKNDLAAVSGDIDTIFLPMVEKPAHVDQAITEAKSVSTDVPEFIPTIETARGIFAADEIAEYGAMTDAVTGLSYGFGDYTRSVGATGQPSQLQEYISQVTVSAAAIGGLDPIASVYQDITDKEGLRDQAEQTRNIGYIGQKAIHPEQLHVLNDVYTPRSTEVEEARHFVETFEQADQDSLVVDGVFLDTAIVEQYRTVVRRHQQIAD